MERKAKLEGDLHLNFPAPDTSVITKHLYVQEDDWGNCGYGCTTNRGGTLKRRRVTVMIAGVLVAAVLVAAGFLVIARGGTSTSTQRTSRS
jgi:hypothetical protein